MNCIRKKCLHLVMNRKNENPNGKVLHKVKPECPKTDSECIKTVQFFQTNILKYADI